MLPFPYLGGDNFQDPIDPIPIGQGFAPKFEDLDTFGTAVPIEYPLEQLLHLVEFDQKGIMSMQGMDLAISNVAPGLCPLFKGFLVFLGGKEQIGIDPDDVDLCIPFLQIEKSFRATTGNIDGL